MGIQVEPYRRLLSSKTAWVCIGLVAATLAVYAPVRHFGFVNYDDGAYVTANPQVLAGLTPNSIEWAWTTGYFAYWHPLTWLSLMLDVELYGTSGGGFHVTNLLLHLASTLLLFAALRAATGNLERSAFVAALFAVHPLHVETVAWVAERKGVLSTFFWTLALWAYVRYVREPRPVRYLAVLSFFALGLMSKPMVVTLPCVLLLLDFWPLGRLPCDAGKREFWLAALRLVAEKVPLFLLAVGLGLLTLGIVEAQGNMVTTADFPWWPRAAYAAVSYVQYLGMTLWPSRLAAFYLFPNTLSGWTVVACGLGLFATSLIALREAAARPYLLVGWLWFLGAFTPMIGLIQSEGQTMADRYTYLPLTGLFIMAAWGGAELFARWRRGPAALKGAAALALAACVLTARAQVFVWAGDLPLWTHALAAAQESHIAHNNLGAALQGAGRTDEAMAHFSKALGIRASFGEPHNNMASAYLTKGKFAEAEEHLAEALRLMPQSAEVRANAGLLLAIRGKIDAAAVQFAESIRLSPTLPLAHIGLGTARASRGRYAEAIALFSAALRLAPDSVNGHYNLAVALAAQGKNQEAVRHLEAVLRLEPQHADARREWARIKAGSRKAGERLKFSWGLPGPGLEHHLRGGIFFKERRFSEAAAEYAQALTAQPRDVEAEGNLGLSLANQGRMEEAILHYSKALRLDPNYALAHSNLGIALNAQARRSEALFHFSEAVRLKPDYAEARANLGIALAQQGKDREALAQLSEAVRLAPAMADAHFNLAVLLKRMGKLEEAVRHLEETVKLAPGHPRAQGVLRELRSRSKTPRK
ncbi:MAG: tetratricopeptide repeat protein [Elusimicrobia bacterium]|nr:tetratricopeptide repeat protein [Elusimicrobiota bacterium]